MNMHNKRRGNSGMGGSGGQHRHQNNRPRRFGGGGNSGRSGDDNANVARTRRHAQQQREKYQNMARDAMSMGDRVLAENYLQHADHFHRVILSLPPEEQRHQNQQRNQGDEAAAGAEAHANDGADAGADNAEPVVMPSAGALPSFITGQPLSHNPQNFEE